MSAWRRRLLAGLALLSAAGALLGLSAGGAPAAGDPRAQREETLTPGVQLPPGVTREQLVAEGEQLFGRTCASCHGPDAAGIEGVAPSLRGVGELSADFYLRTGRMPLGDPEDQPRRAQSPFSERQIDALVAYVGSLGEGPPVPDVAPQDGSLAEGLQLFTENCAGCHQVVGQGGITTRAVVPDLQQASATDVAEAMVIGPYVMTRFGDRFTDREVNSIARYVLSTRDPVDAGGWGIGHIGPIPEGMVTWFLAIFALLLTIRLIGERTTR